MEFDNGYCIVDGNPCDQGSSYCSDQCREYDLMENQNVFFNGDENDDPMNSLTEDTSIRLYNSPADTMEHESPNYLLYECCFCKSTHTAGAPCTHYLNYKLEPEFLDLNHERKYSFYEDMVPESQEVAATAPTIFEALQNYSKNDDDISVIKSNLSIQHNYRKWLVMGST